MRIINEQNWPTIFKNVLARARNAEGAGVALTELDATEAYTAGLCQVFKLVQLYPVEPQGQAHIFITQNGARVLSELERGIPLAAALGLPGTVFVRDLGVA